MDDAGGGTKIQAVLPVLDDRGHLDRQGGAALDGEKAAAGKAGQPLGAAEPDGPVLVLMDRLIGSGVGALVPPVDL